MALPDHLTNICQALIVVVLKLMGRAWLTTLLILGMSTLAAQDITSVCEPVFIGWSSTGKAALGIKADDQENSRIEYHYKIVDLVTDEILFAKSFMLGYAAFANGFSDETIKSELAGFDDAVKKYNIVRQETMTVMNDPMKITVGSKTYSVTLTKTMMSNVVQRYQLDISNGVKKKPITTQEVKARNMRSIGFLFAAVSPDMKRTVIALVGTTPDADETIFDVQFFGSNLTAGFK